MDWKLLLISLFIVLTVYFAVRASQYKTMLRVFAEYVKVNYGIEFDIKALRRYAAEKLSKKFK